MNPQTNNGVTTTFERGWSHILVGAGALLLSLVLLVVGVKYWLTDVYTAVGPSRSAYVTIIAGLGGLCGGVMALLSGVSVAWLVTRISRNSHVIPREERTIREEPLQELPPSRLRRPIGILSSGNLPSGKDPRGAGSLALTFADKTKAIVPREVLLTALRMPHLRRTPQTWPHDKAYYTSVYRYLLEHHAIDKVGAFDEVVRTRLLEDVDV